MNPYVMLVLATIVVLMVMFGRNPIEEARLERAKYGGDPLIKAIQEHNSKSHFGGGFGAMPTGGQPQGYMPGNETGAAPNYPAYMQRAQGAPVMPGQPVRTAQPQANLNSYYPPPAAGVAPSPLQLQPKPQTPSPQTGY